MSRAARLLDLLQLLRRHRRPVSGQTLAASLGISLRTLYRDIATLQAQGADIRGEAGLGYVLEPGFVLPPLMLAPEEIEALVLGMRFVEKRGDDSLRQAASETLAKIAAVLPPALRSRLSATPLLVGPGPKAGPRIVSDETLRQAIAAEWRVKILYRDAAGETGERIIWPFALGYFETVRMVVAWCETRADFRHFRSDRLLAFTPLQERYPRRRQALLTAWAEAQGIAGLV